jgi:hypothetical protein
MSSRNWLSRLVLCFGVSLAALCTAAAAEMKSPEAVKTSLRLIMQITNDFDRQITRKTYERLPHENEEFVEASGALRQAIANEPADFKTRVEAALRNALAAAKNTADLGAGKDDAKLRAAHAEHLKAVNAVFAFFPAGLRPDPNVQPGRGGAAPR